MVNCAGCNKEFKPEATMMHFGKHWCIPCEAELMDLHDQEYYNSSQELEDLYDAEADAYHSQWDDSDGGWY